MSTVDLGDVYATKVEVRDANGTLADPTEVVCTVTDPAGLSVDVPVQRVDVGVYRAGVRATLPGQWLIHWQATGLHESSETDGFTALTYAPVVSLREAKEFLNITSTTSDQELRRFLMVVSASGEQFTGRVFGRRAVSAEVDGGARSVVVPDCPIVSVSQIAENGSVVAADGYRVRSAAGGVIERRSGAVASWWAAGLVSVDYIAGYQAQPEQDRQGALVMLKHLWETQRGTVRMNVGADEWNPSLTFSVPRRVQELWDNVVPRMGAGRGAGTMAVHR